MIYWLVKFGKQTFLRHIRTMSDNRLTWFKCLDMHDMLGLRFWLRGVLFMLFG